MAHTAQARNSFLHPHNVAVTDSDAVLELNIVNRRVPGGVILHRFEHRRDAPARNGVAEIVEKYFDSWQEGQTYSFSDGLQFTVEKKTAESMTTRVTLGVSLLAQNLITTAAGQRLELMQGRRDVENFVCAPEDILRDSTVRAV
jgi:hypothetical protein